MSAARTCSSLSCSAPHSTPQLEHGGVRLNENKYTGIEALAIKAAIRRLLHVSVMSVTNVPSSRRLYSMSVLDG